MTREELILYGKGYLHDLETTCCKIEEKHKEFVRESIKALEQETVPREHYESEYLARKQAEYELWKIKEQQPSEDCVSRQAVLESLNCEIDGTIESYIDLSKYKREFQEFANMILNAQEKVIQALPPVTPIQKWIPCSERLPEKNGKYLAYIINKKDTNLQYIMTCEYYEGDLWNWFPDDDCASDNVVAWMPLPEPYKAEMERKE